MYSFSIWHLFILFFCTLFQYSSSIVTLSRMKTQVLDFRGWSWSRIEVKAGSESDSHSPVTVAPCAGHSLVSLKSISSPGWRIWVSTYHLFLIYFSRLHRYPGRISFCQLLDIQRILLKLYRVRAFLYFLVVDCFLVLSCYLTDVNSHACTFCNRLWIVVLRRMRLQLFTNHCHLWAQYIL